MRLASRAIRRFGPNISPDCMLTNSTDFFFIKLQSSFLQFCHLLSFFLSSSLYQRLEIRDVFSPNLQVRSILDRSDPKKSKNKMAISILLKNVTTFYTNIF